MKTIRLTDSQVDIILTELRNGICGDDPSDSYDNKLRRLIKKIEEP